MIGQTISHYKILEKLGEGGMGVVYKAEDTKLKRTVALKFLPPELTRDKNAKTRFVHEAQAASALDHPNICTIHEIDEAEGHTFIVMAYVEGQSLREKTDSGPLKLGESLSLVTDIARGLQEAHEKGIVHRDIKSANIMVTKKGQGKITDFGLAKLPGRTKVTRTGTTVGTVAYMSPEQARGEGVDHRTDIWSLGVVIYEMLTGRLPFKGDHEHAVTYQIVHEDPEPITALRTGVLMELERILNKCLEKKSSDRYQHVDELIVDLCKVKRAPAPTPRTNLIKYAAVALVVGILAAITWSLLRQNRAVSPAEEIAVAVVDFRDLGTPDGVTRSAGITSLVQVGLVESSPCRVVSPQYLYDLRRRLFGAGRGPIEEDQALEVARKSGAAMLLSGQMITLGTNPYITWQLVDTRSGKSLGASRVEGDNLGAMADQIITDLLPLLARECGVEEPTLPRPVSALTTALPEAYEHYVAGMLAFEESKVHDAVREFEQAVKLDSSFALAYYRLSVALWLGSPERKAVRDYAEKAWKYRAKLGIRDHMRLEAWREELDGRIPETIAIYRKMLTQWPDDKELLKEQSYTLYYYWYFDEAASVARQGMALYPDEQRFVVNYANSVGLSGRLREALEVSRTYAEQHPEDSKAWGGVAKWYLVMGLPDSSETACLRALEIKPDNFYAQLYIVFCDYYRGNLRRAIENSERLLARSDLLPGPRLGFLISGWYQPSLPFLYAESGRFQKALELFEDARQVVSDPQGEIRIEAARSRLLLRLGRAEEVLRWAGGVSRRSDGGSAALDLVAQSRVRALVALDSLEAARSAQAKYRALALGRGRALFTASRLRAEIELAEKNPEAALAALLEMKRLGVLPKAGWGEIERREAFARAHRTAGRLDEAAKVHEAMLGIFRGHSLSHYDLGQIYEEMGRAADAEHQYEAFLSAWAEADEGLPQLEDAKKRLAALRQASQ